MSDCKPSDDLPACCRCNALSCGGKVCRICSKVYAACHAHLRELGITMNGHVLRVHPEHVPELIDKLSASARMEFRRKHAQEPDLWAKLIAAINARPLRGPLKPQRPHPGRRARRGGGS